jgi:putative Mg2+ transporter-C (MgtC) family protein
MPLTLGWQEIAIRIALTLLAGALIGLNRGEHGRPAGLRTTLLVCLAASVSMIQVNLLLAMSGRPNSSFVMLDLMRLPLGILSGMGFIGAGAIVRKGDLVAGVTTAATLWFVTVIGLCFGGGQLALGITALVLGLAILWLLKYAETRLKRDQRAELVIVSAADGPSDHEIRHVLTEAHCRILSSSIAHHNRDHTRHIRLQVRWHAKEDALKIPSFVERLVHGQGVERVEWNVR